MNDDISITTDWIIMYRISNKMTQCQLNSTKDRMSIVLFVYRWQDIIDGLSKEKRYILWQRNYVLTSCYQKFASFSIFCTVSEYYPVVTKKITKKLPDVRYTLQKTACRYLDLYRNDKRKKSGYKKKTPGTCMIH